MAQRYITSFIIAIVLYSCSSKPTGGTPEIVEEQDESQCENGADGLTYWIIDEYVDNFGDKTGQRYASYECFGTFSNSVADNDSLAVKIIIDSEDVNFKLYEYGTRLFKRGGILFVDVKLANGEVIRFALNNEALGDSRIIKSSVSSEYVKQLFLNDGLIKFHIVNDKVHPTREFKFVYDGMSWDFESTLSELNI